MEALEWLVAVIAAFSFAFRANAKYLGTELVWPGMPRAAQCHSLRYNDTQHVRAFTWGGIQHHGMTHAPSAQAFPLDRQNNPPSPPLAAS